MVLVPLAIVIAGDIIISHCAAVDNSFLLPELLQFPVSVFFTRVILLSISSISSYSVKSKLTHNYL